MAVPFIVIVFTYIVIVEQKPYQTTPQKWRLEMEEDDGSPIALIDKQNVTLKELRI